MKKLTVALCLALMVHSGLAIGATDWTPYFQSMKDGCNYPHPKDGIPSKYQASIVSTKVKGNPKNEGEDVITTYTLKNAIAFGQPITKFEYLQGYEWHHLELYFKNDSFMKLRPQFKLPQPEEFPDVTENTAKGYSVEGIGYIDLKFDQKKKSIYCGMGL